MEQQAMCSESVVKLAKAMLKVQKAIEPALKDRVNNFTKSKYATLNSVMEACSSALTDAGIWVTQYPIPVMNEGQPLLGLVTKLVHAESGEWQSSLLVMPVVKNDPQGFGSALTYARRYGLSSMVGIVTEDDDDGNLACSGSQQNSIKPRSKGTIQEAPKSTKFDHRSHAETVNKSTNQSNLSINPDSNILTNLPKIDGVTFNQFTAEDGTPYITANGNTNGKSKMLQAAGFTKDQQSKIWWKYVDKVTA